MILNLFLFSCAQDLEVVPELEADVQTAQSDVSAVKVTPAQSQEEDSETEETSRASHAVRSRLHITANKALERSLPYSQKSKLE